MASSQPRSFQNHSRKRSGEVGRHPSPASSSSYWRSISTATSRIARLYSACVSHPTPATSLRACADAPLPSRPMYRSSKHAREPAVVPLGVGPATLLRPAVQRRAVDASCGGGGLHRPVQRPGTERGLCTVLVELRRHIAVPTIGASRARRARVGRDSDVSSTDPLRPAVTCLCCPPRGVRRHEISRDPMRFSAGSRGAGDDPIRRDSGHAGHLKTRAREPVQTGFRPVGDPPD
jgi:hypothetical protein